jgi:hypothetical protein
LTAPSELGYHRRRNNATVAFEREGYSALS